ncbi:MAG: sugar phosphate isomerase/epimerase family protein [Nitrososphaerales archaeon]
MFPVGVSIRSDESLVRRVSALGISCVELAYLPLLEGRVASLSEALRSSGVKATSFHAPYGISYDIGSFDPAHRRSALRQHKKHVEYCASLGSEYYVIHPGYDDYLSSRGGKWDDVRKIVIFPREEGVIGKLWKTNASSLAELSDFAAGVGVKIVLETSFPNIMTPEETLSVVRMADRENLGVCLDSGHVNIGGSINPAGAIRKIGHLLWTLHLHDNNGDGDFHLVPGRGNIDWKSVAKALRDVSYKGVLNLELTPADWNSKETWTDIEDGSLFLRRLFA